MYQTDLSFRASQGINKTPIISHQVSRILKSTRTLTKHLNKFSLCFKTISCNSMEPPSLKMEERSSTQKPLRTATISPRDFGVPRVKDIELAILDLALTVSRFRDQ